MLVATAADNGLTDDQVIRASGATNLLNLHGD
jgi:hypothetical protein